MLEVPIFYRLSTHRFSHTNSGKSSGLKLIVATTKQIDRTSTVCVTCWNRDGSFIVVTRQWFVQPTVCGSILEGVKVLSFIQNLHIRFGAHPFSCSVGARMLVDVCKAVVQEIWTQLHVVTWLWITGAESLLFLQCWRQGYSEHFPLRYCIIVIGQLHTQAEITFGEEPAVHDEWWLDGFRVRLGQEFSVEQ